MDAMRMQNVQTLLAAIAAIAALGLMGLVSPAMVRNLLSKLNCAF